MIIEEEDYDILAHYGILRRSGRYPWGTGGNQSTRNKMFLDHVEDLRRQGFSEVDIAKGLQISTTQLRAAKSIAKTEQRQAKIAMAQRLKDKGYSNTAIGERMGLNESTVRSLLAPGVKDRVDILESTSNALKDTLVDKPYLDIGSGAEAHMGISKEKLATAVARLQEEGYTVHYIQVQQLGTGEKTNLKILAGPDVTTSEVSRNRDQIQQINTFSDDGGRSYLGLHPPIQVDPSRVSVKYKEDGGDQADGVIYVRPGVDDLSLGSSQYAQVRIAVGDGHYLKGMAMYKHDLPDGIDLVFNTNKSDTGNKLDAMKPISKDPDNPFGSMVTQLGIRESEGTGLVRQLVVRDSDGTERVTSAMNIVNEEGDWGRWSKNISTQVLSKQAPSLAKNQLRMTYEQKQRDYDDIMALTNPAVKRKLLAEFADSADASAVHLKAAAFPRQATHVILPVNSLKPNEIYAPNYKDGDLVSLVRYPHGGIFEIPELTVNNNHPEAKSLLGQARDAVGIHHQVAERLSGADFDGDTVLVIPNNNRKLKNSPALEGLKGFDPKASYPAYEGMKRMTAREKGLKMGDVSNLITDMTIQGASHTEIAKAVRHSMVVIDAEKHNLNWRQSAIDNSIAQLKEKYQGGANRGASTLISRATSEERVPDRKLRSMGKGGPIDPVTGKKVYEETGATYVNKAGKTVQKTKSSVKLAETDDANTLSSGTPIERVYADHSNKLKALANQARLNLLDTPAQKYSPSAKKVYAKEVSSLDSKLALAIMNRPNERQAQILANTIVKAKRDAYPDMDAAQLKKIKGQALEEARARTGAKKPKIDITTEEWNAIQAGAISDNKLTQILANSDMDVVRGYATPKTRLTMTPAKTARATDMLGLGYTRAEVAEQLGVSLSTLDRSMDGGE